MSYHTYRNRVKSSVTSHDDVLSKLRKTNMNKAQFTETRKFQITITQTTPTHSYDYDWKNYEIGIRMYIHTCDSFSFFFFHFVGIWWSLRSVPAFRLLKIGTSDLAIISSNGKQKDAESEREMMFFWTSSRTSCR